MVEREQIDAFYRTVQSINTKMADLSNLLRWGFLPAVKIDLDRPLNRKEAIAKIAETETFSFKEGHLVYDGTVYHPWHSPLESIEIIDETSGQAERASMDRIWKSVESDQVGQWFQLTNDNHHLYRIYVDNRSASTGIAVTMAEIIDKSYEPTAKCQCDATKYESDFDSEFDSLFDSESQERD
jgi:hypothetical protein